MAGLEGPGIAIAAAALVLLLLAIFKIPVKIVFKLLINTVAGFIALFLINFAGGLIGITIAVNWINAVLVGVFGVSGVALILLLQWLTYLT